VQTLHDVAADQIVRVDEPVTSHNGNDSPK